MNRIHRYTLLAVLTALVALAAPLGADSRSFVMATSQQPVEWNPLKTYSAIEAQLYTALYEGLMTYNPVNLKPVPGVAEDWELSQDKKTYRFHLRSGACFSDGTALTAATFRDSWLKLISPASASPFAGLLDSIKGAAAYRTAKSNSMDSVGIRAVDERTFEVDLEQPTAHFIQIVCHQSLVPIHPKLLAKDAWPATQDLIGNGPYKILSASAERLEMVTNPRYWDRNSMAIDKLAIVFQDDPAKISRTYNAGEINWIESGADYNAISDPYAFQLTPQFSTTFLYFATTKKAYQNPEVRRGLLLMLPLEEIRSKDLFLVPSAQLIPGIPYYPRASGLEKQNTAEGLKALASAGFPNGKGLPPLVIELPKSETWEKIITLMRQAWKELEVKVDIREIDSNDYFSQLNPNVFTIATISWIGDYADPMTFLDLWHSQSSLNRSGFNDQVYDKLLNESNAQQGTPRYKTLSKAEEMLLQGGAVLPINHSPAFNVIDLNRIDGWYENPLNIHPFKYLQFKALKPPRNVARL
jgi:peptide/nickel transport system substrate-binding protein/oligopeptide transport system substrate-binding protein